MKTTFTIITLWAFALLGYLPAEAQTVLASWNFNGTSNTTVAGGENSPTASTGSGTAILLNGTTATFASGNTSVGSFETETTTPPNFGWNTSTYAEPGTQNKQRGVQFNVSTVGYRDIVFRFDQRLSNTAANSYVVQYTANRTVANPIWVDAQTFTVTPAPTGTGDTWYTNRTVNLTGIETLDNNANVAFRIVAAFDPGTGDYLSARSTSTYSPGGTVRFDQVTVLANTQLRINEFDLAQRFSLSPNPATAETVHLSHENNIEVYDITGKLIHKAQDALSIDIRGYLPGVYFVKTATGLARKLIVK
jgi:hypothetical protein